MVMCLGRSAHGLETEAERRLAAAERAKRATAEAAYRAAYGRGARRGRPLGGATDPATVRAVVQAAAEAMARADGTAAVLATVREALRPVDPASGQVRTREAVAGELRAAAARLRALGGRATEATEMGHSPLALAGLPAPHWLDALGYGRLRPSADAEFPARPAQSVNTLAA